MAFYHDRILPRLIRLTMNNRRLESYRKEVLAAATGRVLELGVGSGSNFRCYPPGLSELVAIDPHPVLGAMAVKEAGHLTCPFQFVQAAGESLPFPDRSFDCVVSTFTLCSVGDAVAVAKEVKRVLKDGGCFIYFEHGLSPDTGTRFIQKFLNPIQKRFAGGCQLTRDHFADLAAAGLINSTEDNFYLPKVPGFLGYMYSGRAIVI